MVYQTSPTSGSVIEAAPSAPLRSREPRASVMLAAEVSRFSNPGTTKHRLRDLSPHGARLDKAGSFRRGETILVTVGSLAAIGATVMWVSGDAAGLKFFEMINPDAARSKTIVKTVITKGTLAPTNPSPERQAELAGWLGGLKAGYQRSA